MISIDQAGIILDEIAEELPKEFYKELNGGIILLPDIKLHPAHKAYDLYTMGEYHNNQYLGRYIIIYYGSVERVYGHISPEELKEKLKNILIHEFTHHLETLAGEHALEIKDAKDIVEYKNKTLGHCPNPRKGRAP